MNPIICRMVEETAEMKQEKLCANYMGIRHQMDSDEKKIIISSGKNNIQEGTIVHSL